MRIWLACEWGILFVAFPLFVFSEWVHINRFLLFAPPVMYALWYEYNNLRGGVYYDVVPISAELILRSVLVSCALFISAYLWLPQSFLRLPTVRPVLWLTIMLLYPFVSALPQEILYRQFYFRRYSLLWQTPTSMLVSNIICFALLHIVYDNWVAIFFTLIGGTFFAISYQRTQDLRWPWLEHSIYGLVVFTSGWGQFFYEQTR